MQHAATTWTFASADNRLAELMKAFGCADVIAPVDAEVSVVRDFKTSSSAN
jgi:hypothetical protein